MQDYFCLQPVYCTEHYTGTPLIRSLRGQKNLAVLTADHINEGLFFTRICMVVLPSGQKKVAVRWGSTVLRYFVTGLSFFIIIFLYL